MFSLLVLTRNSFDHADKCLQSIFAQSLRDYETILIDNGSDDGTAELVRERYPKVKVISNEQNNGPCKGRNQGIEAACGDWIITLDCDVVLEKDFLAQIAAVLEKINPGTGMLAPKILGKDRQSVYSCGIFLSWARRFYDIGYREKSIRKFCRQVPVFGPCSAAAVYRRSMLEEIKETTGYFDERFFFFVEDVDIAWRAQRKGWKAEFVPGAVCVHEGKSSGYEKELRQYFCYRNRFIAIRKNEGMFRYALKIVPLLCYDLPRFIFLRVTNGVLRKGGCGKPL